MRRLRNACIAHAFNWHNFEPIKLVVLYYHRRRILEQRDILQFLGKCQHSQTHQSYVSKSNRARKKDAVCPASKALTSFNPQSTGTPLFLMILILFLGLHFLHDNVKPTCFLFSDEEFLFSQKLASLAGGEKTSSQQQRRKTNQPNMPKTKTHSGPFIHTSLFQK